MSFPRPQYRNSAGRLLSMLSSIPVNNHLLEVLPPLMGYSGGSNNDKSRLAMICLIELHSVYQEFLDDMASPEIDARQKDVLLNGLLGIAASIYPTSVKANFRKISEAETALLKVCATIIPEEGEIEKNDLEEIRNAVAELRRLVQTSDISPTLRRVLLELIRLSEDAISRFNIHGARGMKRAFKSMLGELADAYGSSSQTEEMKSDRDSPVWLAMMEFLKKFDLLASKILKYRPLLDGATRFFLGGS